MAVQLPSGKSAVEPHQAPCGNHGHGHRWEGHPATRASDPAPEAISRPGSDPQPDLFQALDPVCGIRVDVRSAKHCVEHAQQTYYFCSAGGAAKFTASPDRYLSATATPAMQARAPAGTIYTCPMHPQVRQEAMGSCSICGMALEPETPSAAAGANAELADMVRRLWIGAILALPVVLLEMAGHFLGRFGLSRQLSNWIQLVLATPVVIWAGCPFFERGWHSLVSRNLNMFTLISLGTGTAWIYSVVATVFPQLLPLAVRDQGGSAATYFEAAAVITVLVLVGQALELRAREQTSGAIRALLDLAPKTARRVRSDGSDEDVVLDQIQLGDRLRVRPGEKVPTTENWWMGIALSMNP